MDERLTNNEKFIRKFECLISHGLSIRTLSEITGIEPEEVAKYICLVWGNKNNVNKEKLNKGFSIAGHPNPAIMTDYELLMENQGINKKEKIMIK